jgi:hypothetical protein
MTPREKAQELIRKYTELLYNNILTFRQYNDCKECALIAVDEIAKCTKYEKQQFENDRFSEDYWNEVQKEIEKL